MNEANPSLHRQRAFRVEAIVLRHLDWGEADRLIWLFTRELGKSRAVGKGIRKPRSRKAGHLEPFTRVNLLLAQGRDLPIITQAETVDAYLPLRDDLLRTTYASYVVELLDRFTYEASSYEGASYEEGENRGLYHLLADTLARLCQPLHEVPATILDLVVRYYELHMLDFMGFRPQLFQCAACGKEIRPEDQYFSAHQGGVLCPGCGKKYDASWPISLQALKYLRHFQRSNFTEAQRARLTPQLNSEMEALMQHYMTYFLERGLNTPPFLRRARRDAREGAPGNENE